MASIIPGYNYDIFISYRQKDNRHDGWVTEFVNNLKGELESTFKEEISVYFDINPHDGLLETHDVYESLKEKLKCLIFIPIISRTYCDPKSFAWEHEFKAFVEMASKDRIGLKVKLPNGNVASRVLPVRIHDLDPEDIKQCEAVLGGLMRGIEFIYREPGVNKPLSSDDDESRNLNKTRYKVQVNKVANSAREIIYGCRNLVSQGAPVISSHINEENHGKSSIKFKILYSSLIIFLLFSAGFLLFRGKSGKKIEKSIVVLPFKNDSASDSTSYFIIGIEEAIRNNLQNIKSFSRVLSHTTTEHLRGDELPPVSSISKDLNVNYVVEGSVLKFGNRFQLNIKLIRALNENLIWTKSFEREITGTTDIFHLESEIAQNIAGQLESAISPLEMKIMKKPLTENLEALDAYMKGEYYRKKNTKNDLEIAKEYYTTALKKDPGFVAAYCSLAMLYDMSQQLGYLSGRDAAAKHYEAIKTAMELDSTIADVRYGMAVHYSMEWNWEAMETEFKKSLGINQNNPACHACYSLYLLRLGKTIEAERQMEMALRLDPIDPEVKGMYCHYLFYRRQYENAINAGLEALKIDSDFAAKIALAWAYHLTGNQTEAIKFWKSEYIKMYPGSVHAFDEGYAKGGYFTALNLEADTLAAQSVTSNINPGDIALLYASAGNKEKSLKFWQLAYELHDMNIIFLNVPLNDFLRDDSSYQFLCRQMKLPINR